MFKLFSSKTAKQNYGFTSASSRHFEKAVYTLGYTIDIVQVHEINWYFLVNNIRQVLSKHNNSLAPDSDTVSTYQVSSVQLVTDKKLEAFNKA